MMGSTIELTVQRATAAGVWPVVAEYHRAGQLLPVRSEGELRLQTEPASASPRTYGETLGEALFSGPIRDAYVAARGAAPVRVWLCMEDATLRTWRWEWLCGPVDSTGWDFLSLDQRALYSLYLPSLTDRPYPPIGRRDLRALVLVANPVDPVGRYGLTSFDAPGAVRRLEAVFSGRMSYDVLARLPEAIGPPTLDGLVTQLTNGAAAGPYSVLHLVCHGRFDREADETWIYLEQPAADATGAVLAQGVSATTLLERLKRVRQLPHFVFLSVCESGAPEAEQRFGGLAQRLVRELGIPAVIGMTEPVTIAMAHALSEAFYSRLLQPSADAIGAVDRALVEAYAGLASRLDIHVPALYSRLGDRPLFSPVVDRELGGSEIRDGLAQLNALLADRAPVLQSELAKHRLALEQWLETDPATSSADAQQIHAASLQAIADISQEALDISFHELVQGTPVPAYDARQPFRGLSPFRAEDRDFFFGREPLIDTLVRKLAEDPFLPVLGPSGSGKSSVVLAGLVPRLQHHQQHLQVAYLTPGSTPVEQLHAVQATVHGGPVLYVVDQFEEVFTACRDEAQRRTFIDALLNLARHHAVVMTMRADFWGECAPYKELRLRMQSRQELIAAMTTAELRSAMEQQAAKVGLRFEADLSQTILDEVAGEPGAMPLLQHALLELWKRRHGRWLRAVEYRAIGGVKQAIAQTADRLYAELPAEQDRIRDIFLRLTQLDEQTVPSEERRDTRRRVPFTELVPAGADPDRTKSLVKRLADAVLVTTGRNTLTDQDEVEVAHEALIRHWARLRRWLETSVEQIRAREGVREAAQDWTLNPSDESLIVHRGRRLEAAEELLRQHALAFNELELRYLDACLALREREAASETKREEQELETARAKQREAEAVAAQEAALRREAQQASKARIRISIAAAVMVVAVVSAIFLLRRSEQQEALNRAISLVTQSRAAVERAPLDALSLALEAVVATGDSSTAQNVSAINNLRSVLADTRSTTLNAGRKGINAVAFGDGGRNVAVAFDDGAALICPWPLVKEFSGCIVAPHEDPVVDARFLGRDWLLTVTDHRWKDRVADLAAEVWDGTDSFSYRLFLWRVSPGDGTPVRLELGVGASQARTWSISDDGHWLVVGCEDGRLLAWRVDKNATQAPTFFRSLDGSPITSVSLRSQRTELPSSQLVYLLEKGPPLPAQWLTDSSSQAGYKLAVGSATGSAALWGLEDTGFTTKASLPNQKRGIWALAFGHRANVLVTGTGISREPSRTDKNGVLRRHGNAYIRTWRVGDLGSKSEPIQEFVVEDDRVEQLSLSDDDAVLVVASASGFRRVERRSLLKRAVVRARLFDVRSSTSERDDIRELATRSTPVVDADVPLTEVVFMPATTTLFAGTLTGQLRLVDIDQNLSSVGFLLHQRMMRGHTSPITAIAVTGRQVVTGSLDGTVRAWDLDGWEWEAGPFYLPGHSRGVDDIQTDASGRWLATRSDRTVAIWDLTKSPPARVVERFGFGAVFLPESRVLVVSDGATEVLNLTARLEESVPLSGRFLAVSRSGRLVVTGDLQAATTIWKLDGQVPTPIRVPASETRGALFSDDENTLLTLGYDSVGQFWRLDALAKGAHAVPAGQFTVPRRFIEAQVALRGSSLVTEEDARDTEPNAEPRASKDADSLYLWRLDFESARATKSKILNQSGPLAGSDGLISADEKWLVRGVWDRYLEVTNGEMIQPRLLRLTEGAPEYVLDGPSDLPRAAVFSSDNQMLAIGSRDASLDIWHLASAPPKATRLRDHRDSVDALQFSDDTRFLVSASRDGNVRLWTVADLAAGSEVFEGGLGPLDVVHLDKEGRLFAGGDAKSVVMWRPDRNALIRDACKTIIGAVTAGQKPVNATVLQTLCASPIFKSSEKLADVSGPSRK